MSKTVIALCGPTDKQFARVLRKLGRAYTDRLDFRLVDRSGSRGLPNADVFVLWTKYAGSHVINAVKKVPSDRVRRVKEFNDGVLRNVLGPPPAPAPKRTKESPPPSTVSGGGTSKPASSNRYRFRDGTQLAFICCAGCTTWKATDHYHANPQLPHGVNVTCKECLQTMAQTKKQVREDREAQGRRELAEGKLYYQGKRLCQSCWKRKAPNQTAFAANERESDGLDAHCKSCRNKEAKAAARKADRAAERATGASRELLEKLAYRLERAEERLLELEAQNDELRRLVEPALELLTNPDLAAAMALAKKLGVPA